MLFNYNIYSTWLLIPAIFLLVHAGLIAAASRKAGLPSGPWLAGLLLLAGLYISPWMLGFAGWYDNQPYRNILFYTPTNLGLAFGPLLLAYLRKLLYPQQALPTRFWLHFLPAGIWVLLHMAVAINDFLLVAKPLMPAGEDEDFWFWIQLAGIVSQLIYLVVCLRLYKQYQQFVLNHFSFAEAITYRWLRRCLITFLAATLLISFSFLLNQFVDLDYSGDWWRFFLFALIVCYLAHAGWQHYLVQGLQFAPLPKDFEEMKAGADEPLLQVDESPLATVDSRKEIAEKVMVDEALLGRLQTLMLQAKAYRRPDLSLVQVAEELNVPRQQISQLLNGHLGVNFNDFINGFRVDEVVEKLAAGQGKIHTLMSIAYDAGFNSKATFNRAFKKKMGYNPSEGSNSQA